MQPIPLRTTVIGSYPFSGWLEYTSQHLDFNLSFYGFLAGIELETRTLRQFGPPAHDQRGRHRVVSEIEAPRGLGPVEEFERLKRLAPSGPTLKASVPGPSTMSGRPRTVGGTV